MLKNWTYGHKYYVILLVNMSHYILLLNWTDQGIRNVKDTIKRADAFKSYLEKKGGKLTDIFYTFGQYDLVLIVELPNDDDAMSVLLGTGALGNIRSTTLKAFNLEETRRIVENLK
jgi:uncharacterized protein with GYD domain